MSIKQTAFWLAVLLALAAAIFWPGTTGIFHFDDVPNLAPLAHVPPGLGWAETISFGLSQFSGATRVLPHLSFVAQADAWPGNPGVFIAFNILLHLINGVLVFLLARKLAVVAGLPHAGRISLLAAAIWLLSPLQVAGVLYVVQRINQMAALFVFAGALVYLHGRAVLPQGGWRPVAWMIAGVTVCGALAVLSKENGALLPLLLLVAELTLLPTVPQRLVLRRLLLLLPLACLVVLLFWQMPNILSGYVRRDFGLPERVLTQPSVILDYLKRFLLPRGAGLSLFHDDWPLANWPPDGATWLAIATLSWLMFAAVMLRRRWPVFAFGVLWFLAGHALESTFIPLELYFEHRNYLPLFGPAFALAASLSCAYERASIALKPAVGLLVIGWLAVATSVTYNQATLWGYPAALYEVWLYDHPDSPRANGAVAVVLAHQGFADAAVRRLEHLVRGPQPRPEYYVQWLQLSCDGRLQPPAFHEVIEGLAAAGYSTVPVNSLTTIADRMHDASCPALSPLVLVDLVRVLEANPKYAQSRIQLKPLAGRFLELGGRYEEALAEIGAAYRLTGSTELGFIELRLLNALGRRTDLEKSLDVLERHIRAGGIRYDRYLRDVENWRRYIAAVS